MYVIIRNIYRNKYKSIITVIICTCLVLLLNVYLGNIESNERQLEELPEAVPVYCIVTSLNGNRQAGLAIKGDFAVRIKCGR